MKTVPEKQSLAAWKHGQAEKRVSSVRFTDMDMIDIVSEKSNCGELTESSNYFPSENFINTIICFVYDCLKGRC